MSHVLPEFKTTFEPTIDINVAEHWLLHPALNSVAVFRRSNDRLVRVAIGDTLTTPLLPWFALGVHELFS